MWKISSATLLGLLIASITSVSCDDGDFRKKTTTSFQYKMKFGEMVESCSRVKIENFDNLGRTLDFYTYDCEGNRIIGFGDDNESYKYIDENIHIKIIYADNKINHIDSVITSKAGRKVTTYRHYPQWLEGSDNIVEWRRIIDIYDEDGELLESTQYETTGEVTLKDVYKRDKTNSVVFQRYLFKSLRDEITTEYDEQGNQIKRTREKYDYNPLNYPISEGKVIEREIRFFENEYDSRGNLIKREINEVEGGKVVPGSSTHYKYDQDDNNIEALYYDEHDLLDTRYTYKYVNGNLHEEIKYDYDYTYGGKKEHIKRRHTYSYSN